MHEVRESFVGSVHVCMNGWIYARWHGYSRVKWFLENKRLSFATNKSFSVMPFWQLFPFDERKNTHFANFCRQTFPCVCVCAFKAKTKWYFRFRDFSKCSTYEDVLWVAFLYLTMVLAELVFNFNEIGTHSHRKFCVIYPTTYRIANIDDRDFYGINKCTLTINRFIVWTLHKGERGFFFLILFYAVRCPPNCWCSHDTKRIKLKLIFLETTMTMISNEKKKQRRWRRRQKSILMRVAET